MSQQYNAPQQPGGYQPNYPQGSPDQMRGQQLAQTSMILGIISLFAVGIILGPLAIIKAKRAEELGGDAKVGKITGWIGTVLGALWIVGIIIYIIAFVSLMASVNA
ncbi:DUF4190 domain-containing protein [Tessaracoccus antarcticus]|uniref:DUF4190 domain-containing protein n=1 Tax=Tessaracoccus antarcticus TaxID=2479848 RepID=A0A3M0G1H2_9ACTN|nr:DUF4190 domain-containing protein [Tessaracoccus antarcticus]RMB58821.1 DUF4190 domain-containing protein [Tessaracoccus antarcticus]